MTVRIPTTCPAAVVTPTTSTELPIPYAPPPLTIVTPVIPPRASTVIVAVAPPPAVLPNPTPTSFAPCNVAAEPDPYPTPDDAIPTQVIEFRLCSTDRCAV